jgi:glycosyltransferase involved in cell wall biosynthesis
VSAPYEDFGLTTSDAAQHGKPAAALRYGGFLDTVVERRSGVFFDRPEPSAIEAAVPEVVGRPWDEAAMMACAARFCEASFARTDHETVAEVIASP